MQQEAVVPITREGLGQRIAAVRQRRGLSQAQLAEMVDLAQSAVSRIETGERSIDSIELARLAEVLKVSVLDLLEDRPEFEDLGLAARAEATRDSAALDVALARVKELLRFDRVLDQLGAPELPRPSLPAFQLVARTRKAEGKSLAQQLREALGLGTDPIQDLAEVIEWRIGLDVALEPLPEALSGLCIHAADAAALALVDSSPVVGRQRFTMAHELCHHLIGDPEPVLVDEHLFSSSPREVRANSFAAYFLMPEDGIRRHIKDSAVDGRVVVELQHAYGVSLDALCWHLVNLRLLSDSKRRSMLAAGPKALAYQHGYYTQWQAGELLRDLVQPPLRLLRRGLTAYAHGFIGIDRLADLLRVDDREALRRELEDAGVTPDGWLADTAHD